ncbi:MAG: DUF3866 family protein [Actinomycetales bacterium]|nr:DUF3866 family protein [Actinomycetales bacterium]
MTSGARYPRPRACSGRLFVILWREGRVVGIRREWGGAVELDVEVCTPGTGSGGAWSACRALAYPALVGRPEPNDLVLLNTTALERGLGTGGYAFVVAVPQRPPVDPPIGPGHLVKARYTPLQAMVLGVDDPESPDHETLAEADDLFGMPVVTADLHSAVPAIVAGIRESRPDARIVYVLTDGGALPAWFSMTVASLRDAGWISACVSTGQAFGGDHEAVTVHTGLLTARLVRHADVAVVAQGPGNLGTDTRWGFSGVSVGEAINAAGVLHGRPVAALRVSQADPRPRHRGVSHHTLTAVGRVAQVPADVAVPLLPGAFGDGIREAASRLGPPTGRHRLVEVGVDGLLEALKDCPVPLRTMGRGLDDDPASFLAAAAAGRHAASLLGAPARG